MKPTLVNLLISANAADELLGVTKQAPSNDRPLNSNASLPLECFRSYLICIISSNLSLI